MTSAIMKRLVGNRDENSGSKAGAGKGSVPWADPPMRGCQGPEIR